MLRLTLWLSRFLTALLDRRSRFPAVKIFGQFNVEFDI